jgi:hypothetical protein
MPRFLADALELHRAHQVQNQKTLEPAYDDNDLVCCYEDGRIWMNRSPVRIFNSCARSESESGFTTCAIATRPSCCVRA